MTLIKITISLSIGILLNHLDAPAAPWLLCPAPLLTGLSWFLLRSGSRKVLEIIFQASLLTTFVLVGLLLHRAEEVIPANDIRHLTGRTCEVEARAMSDSQPTKYGQKVYLECLTVVEGDQPICGNTLAYLSEGSEKVMEGDLLRLRLSFQDIKTPYEGYRNWLAQKGIFTSAKVRDIVHQEPGSGALAKAAHLRSGIKGILFEHMPDPDVAGLASAILLGDKSQLSQDIRENFSQAGMSHVLAISGLHVGIIFLFLNRIFGFLAFSRAGRVARVVLVLGILIAYMVMTGCSPAVCRAVLMISLVQLGKLFHRESQGLNTLAAAALVLLVANPGVLMSVGFQLSFAAVAGIMLLAPRIQGWASEKWSWGKAGVVGSAAVCISAQAFTAPLIWYHFGSFPTYFLVANLLLLPIASFSVNLGFVSLFLCWVPWLNEVLLGMLDFWLWMLASLSGAIASLPASTITRLSFSEPGFCILVGMAIVGVLTVQRKVILENVRMYRKNRKRRVNVIQG